MAEPGERKVSIADGKGRIFQRQDRGDQGAYIKRQRSIVCGGWRRGMKKATGFGGFLFSRDG
jgi:hypothetical protein